MKSTAVPKAEQFAVKVNSATFRRLKRLKKATGISLKHLVSESVAAHESTLLEKVAK